MKSYQKMMMLYQIPEEFEKRDFIKIIKIRLKVLSQFLTKLRVLMIFIYTVFIQLFLFLCIIFIILTLKYIF